VHGIQKDGMSGLHAAGRVLKTVTAHTSPFSSQSALHFVEHEK